MPNMRPQNLIKMAEIKVSSLFPEYATDRETPEAIAKKKAHERWIQKKFRSIGTEYSPNAFRAGKYGITRLRKYTGCLPHRFITLQEVNAGGGSQVGVLGFSYDYELDQLESNARKYVQIMNKYLCMGEPDFSMRIGDTLGNFVSASVRSHNIAFYYQENGCSIIPTMKWADEPSYEVCFDGYEKGGAVLVSTMGAIRDERSQMYFKNGFYEMLKRISPDAVILYGEMKDWMAKLFPTQLEVRHIENEHLSNLRRYGR